MIQTDTESLSILDSTGFMYFETDLSGKLTFANGIFSRSTGYSPEELAGMSLLDLADPGSAQTMLATFDAALETGQPQNEVEYHFEKRDGAASVAEGVIAPILDADGHPAGFRGVMHDVTVRKRAEEAAQTARRAAERELEIGRRIQADFLPEELPQPPGWEIASYFKGARMVSGDFYDAFALSGGKRYGLVMADVCDKGVGAALFMALFRSLIRAFADQHYSLGWMDVLSTGSSDPVGTDKVGRRRALLSTGTTALKNAIDLTNNYITRIHGRTNMFATVFFGVLDPATGDLMYINGGHEPPLVIGPEGVKAQLNPTGPAVGLFPGLEFGIQQVTLQPGDTLLAFTDGVEDANSPQDEFYGEGRLLAVIQRPFSSAADLLEHIRTDLEAHIAGTGQYDDITMLAVQRKTA